MKYRHLSDNKIKDIENLIKNSPDMFYKFSTKRGALFWSKKVEEVLGYTEEILKSNPFIWNDSIHPDDKQEINHIINNYSSVKQKTIKYRIKTINGNYIWIQDTLLSVEKKDNEITVEGQARDLSEIKELNKEISDKDSLLHSIIDSYSNAIFSLDTDYRYISFNIYHFETMKELYGVEIKLGHSLYEYQTNQEDAVKSKANIDRALKGERFIDSAYSGLPNKKRIYIEVSHNPIRDKEAKIIGVSILVRDITKQKIENQKLKDSEEKLRHLFDTMSQGVVYHDKEGKIISVNPACEKIMCLSSSYLIGRTMYDEYWHIILEDGTVITGDDFPSVLAHKTKQRVGPLIRGVYVPSKRDYVWLSIISTPIFHPNTEQIYQVYSVFEDITEKIIAEEKIKQKDHQFNKLSTNMPGMMFQLTKKNNGTYFVPIASSEIKNIFGCTPEEVKNDFNKSLKYIHPDDCQRVLDTLEESAKNLTYIACQFRVTLPNQNLKWILLRSTPEKLVDGSVTWYGFNTDITMIKNIQEKYRETNEYLENLFNYANAPIIVWDNNLSITRFNKAFENLSNYKAGEVIGKNLEFLFPNDKKQHYLKLIKETSSGAKWETVEIEILRQDKEIRTVLWNSANIFDNQKTNIIATVAQGQDITDRKLAEQNLIKAKEQAEIANNAKSEFLANMSHEIRTPLNGVIGFTELLRESELNPTQKEYLKYIDTSAHALLDVINDILDFSKIEAGKFDLDLQKADIYNIVRESLDIIYFQAKQKDLKVRSSITANTPKIVFVDSIRLKQVLVNLLNNAVKFTEKGLVELDLAFEKISDSKGKYTFSIKDTGIGISKENSYKLFKAFSQADTSITRKYGGTGLGLVISNLLVEKMGGRIDYTSEPGKGSKFFFSLTVNYENEPQILVKNQQEYCKCLTDETLEPKATILIAEDVEINMRLTIAYIKKILPHATILKAYNGNEAIEIFKNENIDLIFMDIQMPELDGLKTTEYIRELELATKQHTIIIALSAGVLSSEIDSCFKAGVDDFMPKPVRVDDLKTILNKHLCKN